MTITPEEFRKLWVEALESGEYKQGRSSLQNTDDGFCCLGVASEVYRQHVDSEMEWKKVGALSLCYNFGKGEYSDGGYLHKDIESYLNTDTEKAYAMSAYKKAIEIICREQPQTGLREELERVWRTGQLSLPYLNDSRISFATIAKIIREVPEAFFKDA